MKATKPRHRICRTLGEPVCGSPKCPALKRPYGPGQHGPAKQRRRKVSEYGLQLREKQKLRHIYGMTERQFRIAFGHARRGRSATGEALLRILERRLDNLVYRAGLARTRAGARQLVNHGHVTVNGKKVDIPSYSVKPGDTIGLKESSRNLDLVKAAIEAAPAAPDYMQTNEEAREATLQRDPNREEIPVQVQENLIVEYYSLRGK